MSDTGSTSSCTGQYAYHEYYYRTENYNNCMFSLSLHHSKKKYTDNLDSKLNAMMFPEIGITVEKMLNMVQSMRLRNNWNDKETSDVITFAKVLAGPEYGSFDFSNYLFKKFCMPSDELKAYTFYDNKCKETLKEFVTKKGEEVVDSQ